jgi:hypothetical protein
LAAITLSISGELAVLATHYEADSVEEALGITMLLTAGLTCFAFQVYLVSFDPSPAPMKNLI